MVVPQAGLSAGPTAPGAVGLVVAGGRSRRMGRDKALLPWGQGTLLDHAIARLRACCERVHILSGAEERYVEHGLPVARDQAAGRGPLGGLLTGLQEAGESPAVFLAVDVPHLPVALLRHLLALAAGWDAVVPVLAEGPQPVTAVYQPRCLEAVRRRLDAGERTMTCFWPDVRVRRVEEGELAAFGPPAQLFANVNTPEEYQAARDPPR